MNRLSIALVLAVGIATPAAAAPSAQLPCVYDVLAADRAAVADAVLNAKVGSPASDQAGGILQSAVDTCTARHGWNRAKAQLSASYAVSVAVFETQDLEMRPQGVPAGKIKALWTSLSAEEKAGMRSNDPPDSFINTMRTRIREAGIPIPLLGSVYVAMRDVSDAVDTEAKWNATP